MLVKKNITVNDQKFTVQEISIGAMLPILPRLQGKPEEQQEAQIDMMKMCILQDEKLLGENVLGLGLSTYLKLAEEVMRVNGLEIGKEGKDSTRTNKQSTV